MNYKNTRFSIYLPLLLAATLAIGILLGSWLKRNQDITGIERKLFSMKNSSKLSALVEIIERNYVNTLTADSLVEMSIPLILSELDPHSVYIPAVELREANEPLEGNFDGIGIEFNIQKDTIMVVNTIAGGPSEKIGILAGDRIVKVNDTLVAGIKITNEKVIKKLKGVRGTKVKVEIARRGYKDLLKFDLIRDKIPLYSIDAAYMIDNEIGYIKITRFASTTHKEFVEKSEMLFSKGMKKMILDLRGNGGGYLGAAVDMSDELLSGDKMIVYTEGKSRPREEYKTKNKGVCEDIELVVLIDPWSASASEILAGSIQDNDRGTIVGQRSFGKGLVQEPMMFSDGSSLRLTVARYYTPSGRCIQKPYNGGGMDYFHDIGKRMERGEMESADSMKLTDTVKYKTTSGRIVYGGGGIMPDLFVPVDTAHNSPYLSKVSATSLTYRFALQYTDNHRNELKKFKAVSELQNYLQSQSVFKEFVQFAAREKITANDAELKKSGHTLEIQVYAYIARNMLDNEGFYPIISQVDNTLKKAIEKLKKK